VREKILGVAGKMTTFVRVAAFFCVLAILFSFVSDMFRPVWLNWNNFYTINGFYEEPKDTIETIFLGASVVASGIDPAQLYREYGISAYNLGTEHQGILTSYYWVEETYRLHSDTLKTVVLDVSLLRQDTTDAGFHKAVDGMKFSGVKLRAVLDYTDNDVNEAVSYIIPFVNYHTRWKELDAQGIYYRSEPAVNGTRGYQVLDGININRTQGEQFDFSEAEIFGTSPADAVPVPLYDDALLHLRMMYDFCEERGIQIVLIKTPSINWGRQWSVAVQEVADKYGLPYFDFCYEPYIDEINVLYETDTSDLRHLNYYGASKLTRWLGEYLVSECGATDVRGKAGFEHLEEQAELYRRTVAMQYELSATSSAERYIEYAIQNEMTVFVASSSEAAAALTNEQRHEFERLGLKLLADIGSGDSYLAVIENGEVVYEDIQKNDGSYGNNRPLTYEGELESGVSYKLRSGGTYSGRIASCMIDDIQYADNLQGLNFVVYDSGRGEVVSTDVFDTGVSPQRKVYSVETVAKARAASGPEALPRGSIEYDLRVYLDRIGLENEIKDAYDDFEKKGLMAYIDNFAADPDNMILISAKEEAARGLSDKSRKQLVEYGLPVLAELKMGGSYIACIEYGEKPKELTGGSEAVTFERPGIFVESSREAASISIDGVEYSPNERGLNVVVYNRRDDRVLSWMCFDTHVADVLSIEK